MKGFIKIIQRGGLYCEQPGQAYAQSMRDYWEEQQKRLSEWENKLKLREEKLKEEERRLTSKEAELTAMGGAIREAAAQIKQEREQMKAAAAPCKASGIQEEALQDIKKQFMSITRELQQTRGQLAQLDEMVNHASRDGICLLCSLHRDLVTAGDPRLLPYANRLSGILQTGFDAEPVEPCPGEYYDSSVHERIDSSRQGEMIIRCMARGWRRENEVLMRAVVETGEGSLLG